MTTLCQLIHGCEPPVPSSLSPVLTQVLEFLIFAVFLGVVAYLIKIKHYKTLRNMGTSLVAILLFEILLDPVVINAGFSSWTYIFHDITLILTIGWIVIISSSISLVDFAFAKLSQFKRFWLYLILIDMFAIIAEIFLISNGLRSYIPALVESAYGYYLPFTAVPIGVVLVIPMMFALIIAFTKYWEAVFDARK